MKNIVKIFGLMSIIAVIPGAMAATSRVAMVGRASPRLPSIAGYIAKTSTLTKTSTSYLADPDCLSNYTDCIKGNEACGSNFEECTTNVLLHAKMPNCLGVLSQCSANGVKSLFGTNSMSAITTPIKDGDEITGYTYPTSDSVLGQMVTGAQIANSLNTDQCVKKYTNCLKKDAVCGADFELCTDKTEFKKQAIACESTLARCKNDGKSELFGSTTAANNLKPEDESRLDEMIKEGAALAVNNAVATCNKVTDQCILNACSKNPNKCVKNRAEILIRIADSINGGRAITNEDLMNIGNLTTDRDIGKYIRQECQQTVGSNRYCYMTVKKAPVTKESVLTDPDNVEEVFDDMYNGDFGRFAALQNKIVEIVEKFDSKIQDKCIDTMSSCAMRSCGGGVGSVCYTQSKDSDGKIDIAQDNSTSYKEIKNACRAIVDVDPNCQYSAVLKQDSLFNSYMSDTQSVFTELFPAGGETDPIGVIAYLNSLLATSYNEAAIESLKKQCQTTALACVRSMCGKDYVNCYRNRTDVSVGTYETNNVKFDKSMNKVGGILDYNIVIGLCMNTIKNSSVCEEHLKIAANEEIRGDNIDKNSWYYETDKKDEAGNPLTDKYGEVRDAWLGSNTTSVKDFSSSTVVIGCRVPQGGAVDDCCNEFDTMDDINGKCDAVIDSCGCAYTETVTQSMSDYVLDNAGKSLFQKLLVDVEREVQAKYNAKLTKEQNVCNSNNNGGVRGSNENGSTFMWVKLRTNKVPKTYSQKGLKATEFLPSNDLYGAFCRARITVASDDPAVQKVLSDPKNANDSVAYFAVGDSFSCGSWLSEKTLAKITEQVKDDAVAKEGLQAGSAKSKAALVWGTVAPFVVSGIAGYLGMDAIQKKGGTLGGIVGDTSGSKAKEYRDNCQNNITKAQNEYALAQQYIGQGNDAQALIHYNNAVNYANIAKQNATDAGQSSLPAFGMAKYTPGTIGSAGQYEWGSNIGNAKSYVQKAIARAQDKQDTYTSEKNTYAAAECRLLKENLTDLLAKLNTNPIDAKAGENIKTECKEADDFINCFDTDEETLYLSLFPELSVTTVQAAVTASNGARLSSDTEYNNFQTKLGQLASKCSEIEAASNENGRRNANLVASAVTSVAAGALGLGIAKTALDVKRDNIGNEALQEWMQEIGEHIHCYLGTEELGSFGDVISIEVE